MLHNSNNIIATENCFSVKIGKQSVKEWKIYGKTYFHLSLYEKMKENDKYFPLFFGWWMKDKQDSHIISFSRFNPILYPRLVEWRQGNRNTAEIIFHSLP